MLSFEGDEGVGLQGAVHECLGVPCVMDVLYVSHWSLWDSWWPSAEVRCALGVTWAVLSGQGSLNMLLCVLVLGATTCCTSLGSHVCHLPVTAWWLCSDSWLGSLTCEGFSQMFIFDSPQPHFHEEMCPQTKGSESSRVSLCPWLWCDFVCGERLDGVPEQWGYPGRPSCRWQQTNISHYIFPFSEGYSLSS